AIARRVARRRADDRIGRVAERGRRRRDPHVSHDAGEMTSMPDVVLWSYAALVGAVVGSFLNVGIVRWPAEESVVRPRSRCPGCRHPIAWYDNVPVLSYLLLRGRCRHCGRRISIQYPIVE